MPEYVSRKLLLALGLATIVTLNVLAAPGCGKETGPATLPPIYNVPEPVDPDNYCLRTYQTVTVRKGENIIIREITDKGFQDAIKLELKVLEENNNIYFFSMKSHAFSDIKLDQTGPNSFVYTGITETGQKVSYVLALLSRNPDSVTVGITSSRCESKVIINPLDQGTVY